MDKKLLLFGKEFLVQTFADATANAVAFTCKSAFSEALLFSVTYNLSGVNSNMDYSELTKEQKAKLRALRESTPKVTAKDLLLRPFALKRMNDGRESKVTLAKLNELITKEGTFEQNKEGRFVLSEDASSIVKEYISVVSNMLLEDTIDVYCVRMPVSELTNGKCTTWKPPYSDDKRAEVVCYDVDFNTLQATAMQAIGQMFASLESEQEEEEEK